MRNSALKFLLVLSLLLNGSMLVSAGYTHYQQSRHPFLPSACVPESGKEVHTYLFKALSLAPDKEELMSQKANAFHANLEKKRKAIDEKRAHLLSLMRAEVPDTQAIRSTIAEINRTQGEMQTEAVSHMLEFKSMLNKEQQKKFLDLVEGAMSGKNRLQCL